MEYHTEDFEVYLYKNNLWLKGKKNFFGQDYSKNYIRFTYGDDFTFNIFETEIRDAALSNLPKITFSVELLQKNPDIPKILQVNTFIGSEQENELHTTKMAYPEYIIHNNKTYTDIVKVEMPTDVYKKKHLENNFELCMFNCRLYVISKYLNKKIYFGTSKLRYELWTDDDNPEYSLELCPKMDKTLDLDEIHEESDDEADDDYEDIREEVNNLSLRVSNLNVNVNELQSKLNTNNRNITFLVYIGIITIIFMFVNLIHFSV